MAELFFLQTDEERSRSFKITLESFNRTYSKRTDGKLTKIDVRFALSISQL